MSALRRKVFPYSSTPRLGYSKTDLPTVSDWRSQNSGLRRVRSKRAPMLLWFFEIAPKTGFGSTTRDQRPGMLHCQRIASLDQSDLLAVGIPKRKPAAHLWISVNRVLGMNEQRTRWQNLPWRLLRRAGLSRFLNIVQSRSYDDLRVRIPVHGNRFGEELLFYSPSWKCHLFTGLRDALGPIKQVIDIGANEGQTVIEALQVFGRDVKIAAFEPNPGVAAFLVEMVSLNQFEGVDVFPLGLSNRQGIATLELASENDTCASIVQGLRPGQPHSRAYFVPLTTFDSLVHQGALLPLPNCLIKVDVEGAESEVLCGMRDSLQRYRPVIICEVLWSHSRDRLDFMRERNDKMMALLQDKCYRAFSVLLSKDQSAFLGLAPIEKFPSGIYCAANSHQCDYIFVPIERVDRLKQWVSK